MKFPLPLREIRMNASQGQSEGDCSGVSGFSRTKGLPKGVLKNPKPECTPPLAGYNFYLRLFRTLINSKFSNCTFPFPGEILPM
jgi:hypothetical protein